MKTKNLMIFFIVVISLLLLVSCGDDKKINPTAKPTSTPQSTEDGIDFDDLLSTNTYSNSASTPLNTNI